jgi:molecular chaperone Hsp33
LLQRLPEADEQEREAVANAWEHLTTLADTITTEELLGLDEHTILHRLFHEEDLRLFEAEAMRFQCSCSRERVANALRGLGREEIMDIIQERETVDVNCEFCNELYAFDAIDAERLFSSDEPEVEVPPTRH